MSSLPADLFKLMLKFVYSLNIQKREPYLDVLINTSVSIVLHSDGYELDFLQS